MHIITAALKSWALAGEVFSNESPNYRRKQQWKSLYLTLLHNKQTASWYNILQTPEYRFLTTYRTRLYIKPFRVYISTHFTIPRKMKIIQDTYRYMLSGGEGWHSFITEAEGVTLLTFPLEDSRNAYILLRYDHRYRKEGEMVLCMRIDGYEKDIVATAFSFEEVSPEQWICFNGCVQGHEISDENLSKMVQKKMHGLRPKSFLVIMMQAFCHALGVSEIYAAGDAIQAYRKKHAIHINSLHHINFDYDTFWAECGGTKTNDEWFQLPLVPVRRDIQDIKTTKRALYTRRYKMLDVLTADISSHTKENFAKTKAIHFENLDIAKVTQHYIPALSL